MRGSDATSIYTTFLEFGSFLPAPPGLHHCLKHHKSQLKETAQSMHPLHGQAAHAPDMLHVSAGSPGSWLPSATRMSMCKT